MTSKKIWSRLDEKVKTLVNNSLEEDEHRGQSVMNSYNIFEGGNEDSFDPSNSQKLERKRKMKRFKNLPAMVFPEEIKVKNWD